MKKNELRSDCPINYALEILGDKWSLLIIRDMIFDGKTFYKELISSQEGIATNVLSTRLKRLEAMAIIQSEVYEKQRTQKVYTLTEKGKDLVPVLIELIQWSAKHKTGLNVSPSFVKRLQSHKTEVIQNITQNIGKTNISANN